MRAAIVDGRNVVFASAASAWEITIKKALGKLRAPDELDRAGLTALDITIEHAAAVGELPPQHSDPLDRLLIAQARTERLTLVTRDARIAAYDVPILPA